MTEKEIPTARVVARQDLTDDLMKLWLEPPPEFKDFQPGQYCTIGIDGIERPYSIVSAPHDLAKQKIELFLELIPEQFRTSTSLTPKLWQLNIGDTVTMRPTAKGAFILNKSIFEKSEYTENIFIATVTGIAPFISMLRSVQNGYYSKRLRLDGYTEFSVFQGASYHDEFGYFDELKSMDEAELIIYTPTVSRPKEDRNKSWHGVTGRVNTIVENLFKFFGFTPEVSTIYLCGNEGMIDDLGNCKETEQKPIGKLVKLGYKIKKEVFF